MEPFRRVSHGDDRTVTLQLKQSDTAELLDFLNTLANITKNAPTSISEMASTACKPKVSNSPQSRRATGWK